MAGHSRPKDGVASLVYVPAISIPGALHCHENRDGRDKPGHDELRDYFFSSSSAPSLRIAGISRSENLASSHGRATSSRR